MGLSRQTVGGFAAVALLGLGMLFGAIAMAMYGDSKSFLQSMGYVQGIVAATIALIAAFIAYKAQMAKVEGDAAARNEDREALGQSLLIEIRGRATEILMRTVAAHRAAVAADKEKHEFYFDYVSHALTSVDAALSAFVARAWEATPRVSSNLRGTLIEELTVLDGIGHILKITIEVLSDYRKRKEAGAEITAHQWSVLIDFLAEPMVRAEKAGAYLSEAVAKAKEAENID